MDDKENLSNERDTDGNSDDLTSADNGLNEKKIV